MKRNKRTKTKCFTKGPCRFFRSECSNHNRFWFLFLGLKQILKSQIVLRYKFFRPYNPRIREYAYPVKSGDSFFRDRLNSANKQLRELWLISYREHKNNQYLL